MHALELAGLTSDSMAIEVCGLYCKNYEHDQDDDYDDQDSHYVGIGSPSLDVHLWQIGDSAGEGDQQTRQHCTDSNKFLDGRLNQLRFHGRPDLVNLPITTLPLLRCLVSMPARQSLHSQPKPKRERE
jgi:hypothetical protein